MEMKIYILFVLLFIAVSFIFSIIFSDLMDIYRTKKYSGSRINLKSRTSYNYCPKDYTYYTDNDQDFCYIIKNTNYDEFSSCPYIGYKFNLNLLKNLLIDAFIPATRESVIEPFAWRTMENYGKLVYDDIVINNPLGTGNCLKYTANKGLIEPVDCKSTLNIICLYEIKNDCPNGATDTFNLFTVRDACYSIQYDTTFKHKMVSKGYGTPKQSKAATEELRKLPATSKFANIKKPNDIKFPIQLRMERSILANTVEPLISLVPITETLFTNEEPVTTPVTITTIFPATFIEDPRITTKPTTEPPATTSQETFFEEPVTTAESAISTSTETSSKETKITTEPTVTTSLEKFSKELTTTAETITTTSPPIFVQPIRTTEARAKTPAKITHEFEEPVTTADETVQPTKLLEILLEVPATKSITTSPETSISTSYADTTIITEEPTIITETTTTKSSEETITSIETSSTTSPKETTISKETTTIIPSVELTTTTDTTTTTFSEQTSSTTILVTTTMKPTTTAEPITSTSTEEPTTTAEPTITTSPETSFELPTTTTVEPTTSTTTEEPTTTAEPISTSIPETSTTAEPTITTSPEMTITTTTILVPTISILSEESPTTAEPTTITPETSSELPTTTMKPTTTAEPITSTSTEEPTTTAEPTITTSPETSSELPTTTTVEPTTSTTTEKPTTTAEPTSTITPETSIELPATTIPTPITTTTILVPTISILWEESPTTADTTTATSPETSTELPTTTVVPTTTAEPATSPTTEEPTTTAEPTTTITPETTTEPPTTTISTTVVPTTTAEPATSPTTEEPTTTAEPTTTITPETTTEPSTTTIPTTAVPTTTAPPTTPPSIYKQRSDFCPVQLAEIPEAYVAYQINQNEVNCWFDLITDGSSQLLWETSGKKLSFNYAEFVNSDEVVPKNAYGAVNQNTWTFVTDTRSLSCAICEEKIMSPAGKLTFNINLKYDDSLFITGNNLDNIYKKQIICYNGTKSRSFSTRILIEPSSEVASVFNEFTYYLWCETTDFWYKTSVKSNFLFNANLKLTNRYSILISNTTWDVDLFTINNKTLDKITEVCKMECQCFPLKVNSYQIGKVEITFHIILTKSMDKQQEIDWIQDNYGKKYGTFTSQHIRRIDVCLEEVIGNITWLESPIGSVVVPKECSEEIVYRHCLGNIEDGAYWSEIHGNYASCDEETNVIYELYNSNDSISAIEHLANISQDFNETLTVMKTHYSALILKKYSSNSHHVNSDPTQSNFFEIFNNLFHCEPDLFYESQMGINSTDILLDSMDLYLENVDADVSLNNFDYYIRKGYLNASVVGWLMLQNETLIPISYNTPIDDVIMQKPLIAVFFSNYSEIIDYLGLNVTVSFIFYANTVLFNEESKTKVFPWIASVDIPNFKANLQYPIKVILQQTKPSKYNQSCAYWKYGRNEENINIGGSWFTDSHNDATSTQYLICNYTHMTHFGMIVSELIDDNDVLSILTIMGAALSVLGASAVTGITLKQRNLRDKKNLALLFNYLLSLIILPAALYTSNTIGGGIYCKLSGMFLHYSVLSQSAWTLVLTTFQYKRYVIVYQQHQRYILKKSCLIGWTLGLLPVTIVASISIDNYHKNKSNLCYLSEKLINYSVICPILIITLINLIIFLIIMHNIIKSQKPLTNRKMFWNILKLAHYLFYLFGLTWIFGILLVITNNIYINYIFSSLTSVQGFCVCAHYLVTTRYKLMRLRKSVTSSRNRKPSSSVVSM